MLQYYLDLHSGSQEETEGVEEVVVMLDPKRRQS